jgi:DNA repair exonuclease SbcCD ATPase subunit
MISDIGKWEKLEEIQARIVYLEKKRQRMYSERSRRISDRASVLEYMEEGMEEFMAKMRQIEAELYELWASKRLGLSRLGNSYEWSFAGPMIGV